MRVQGCKREENLNTGLECHKADNVKELQDEVKGNDRINSKRYDTHISQ